MILRITILWIVGGLLIIPYAVYHLLYHAQRDEYAFLIVVPLFWIFGFWGVVGPAIAAWRIRRLIKALERVQDRQQLQEAFERHDGPEVIIELIATENRIPRFLARRLYGLVERRLKVVEPEANELRRP